MFAQKEGKKLLGGDMLDNGPSESAGDGGQHSLRFRSTRHRSDVHTKCQKTSPRKLGTASISSGGH